MDAGYRKTRRVPAEKYGHLEKQKVHRQARESGESWLSNTVGALPVTGQLLIDDGREPRKTETRNVGIARGHGY